MSGISCGDLRFLGNIIIVELRKHRDRIIAHKLRTNIEMDMSKGLVDIVFDSQRVNPTPFKIRCPCEKFSQARWTSLIGQVKRSKEQIFLVSAYISGGISRKVLLRDRMSWDVSWRMTEIARTSWSFFCIACCLRLLAVADHLR